MDSSQVAKDAKNVVHDTAHATGAVYEKVKSGTHSSVAADEHSDGSNFDIEFDVGHGDGKNEFRSARPQSAGIRSFITDCFYWGVRSTQRIIVGSVNLTKNGTKLGLDVMVGTIAFATELSVGLAASAVAYVYRSSGNAGVTLVTIRGRGKNALDTGKVKIGEIFHRGQSVRDSLSKRLTKEAGVVEQTTDNVRHVAEEGLDRVKDSVSHGAEHLKSAAEKLPKQVKKFTQGSDDQEDSGADVGSFGEEMREGLKGGRKDEQNRQKQG